MNRSNLKQKWKKCSECGGKIWLHRPESHLCYSTKRGGVVANSISPQQLNSNSLKKVKDGNILNTKNGLSFSNRDMLSPALIPSLEGEIK